jgi:HAAS domain-containing protein
MITPPDTLDGLVQSYLHSVDRALGSMSADRRQELLGDLSDHIAAELAALQPPTEAGLRAILDRLGDPATVAAEARLLDDSPPQLVGPMPPRRAGLSLLAWIVIAFGALALIFAVVLVVGLIGASTAGGYVGPATPIDASQSPQPTHD